MVSDQCIAEPFMHSIVIGSTIFVPNGIFISLRRFWVNPKISPWVNYLAGRLKCMAT